MPFMPRCRTPTNQHRARAADEEDIHLRGRVPSKRRHERSNAIAIRYLAHCAARRKLVTRRSSALYWLCAEAPWLAESSA